MSHTSSSGSLLEKAARAWRPTMAVPLVLAAALVLAGCAFGRDPANTSRAPYLQSGGLEAAEPGGSGTAVDDALLWARKCAESLETLDQERQKNVKLNDDNQKLSGQLTKVQGDFAKSQAELGEANKLLVEVRQEVQKWKTDVLGFRDEIRKANQVQLEALAKVLTLVGAEVPKESAKPADDEPAAPEKPATPQAFLPAPALQPAAAAFKAPAEEKPVSTVSATTSLTTSPRPAAGKGK